MLTKRFVRHALWTGMLVAGAVMAQDAAISGADFTSGKADAQLSAIGRSASAHDKTVVVTAPTYWQGKVAAQIRAGAHGKPVVIHFANGFYENVLVRTEAAATQTSPTTEAAAKPQATPKVSGAAAAAKPQSKSLVKAKPKPKSEQKSSTETNAKVALKPAPKISAQASTTPVPAPTIAPLHPRATAIGTGNVNASAPQTMGPYAAPPAAKPNVTAVPQVSRQPTVVPIPTGGANPGSLPSVQPPPLLANPQARTRLLTSLNNGRPAAGSLSESALQSGDQIYVDGDTMAVVRMEGLSRNLYWLTGTVDLQRMQYSPLGNGRFEVTGPIDPKAPPTHRARKGAHHVVTSGVPAAGSATRSQMERLYNDGQRIANRIGVARLQPDDRLLLDGNTILVVRREGNSMERYWLDGPIDLEQTGIRPDGANIYQVTGNRLH